MVLVPELDSPKLQVNESGESILGSGAAFWIYTMGLSGLHLPELELRHVPAMWAVAAAEELGTWAQHHLNGSLPVGEPISVQTGGLLRFVIRADVSTNPWWLDHPTGCLTLSVQDVFMTGPLGRKKLH